ncbi:MAG: class I SAM-dependent methyltransferase [Acidobacteriota bacterium]
MGAIQPRPAKELFYDTIADRFDAVMNPYDRDRRLALVFDEYLGGHALSGQTLLDIGCGTGWFAARATARQAHVTGLDVSIRLLEKTREKSYATLIAGDACRLPFSREAFDIVVSSECIEHTQDPLLAVREMCRVLRIGGTLVLTVPNRIWRWSATVAEVFKLRPYEGLENWVWWWQLRHALKAQGLRIVRMDGFHLFPPVVRPTWPVLRRLDRLGRVIGPVMLNMAVKATK